MFSLSLIAFPGPAITSRSLKFRSDTMLVMGCTFQVDSRDWATKNFLSNLIWLFVHHGFQSHSNTRCKYKFQKAEVWHQTLSAILNQVEQDFALLLRRLRLLVSRIILVLLALFYFLLFLGSQTAMQSIGSSLGTSGPIHEMNHTFGMLDS